MHRTFLGASTIALLLIAQGFGRVPKALPEPPDVRLPPILEQPQVFGFREVLAQSDYGLIDDRIPSSQINHREVASAIERAHTVLAKAVENYPKHRDCFSCHHHTLPLLAMRELGTASFEHDEETFRGAAEFTRKFFARGIGKLREGRGIGGQAATVSYGLWTLDIADAQPDDTTAAMVEFLLKTQRDDGRWAPPSNRPPLEESHIATTMLSAYYMPRLCADEQRDEVEKSVVRARHWLAGAQRESQEDHVFALWGSVLLDDASNEAAAEREMQLRDDLLAAQRDDGGWSQLAEMESDAYATGQTLYVLHEAGLPTTSVFYERGVEFLLATQHDDGSWLVETRSRPVQVFFDNGDPHGKSQFISIAATSWAIAALAQCQPKDAITSDDPRKLPPMPPIPRSE